MAKGLAKEIEKVLLYGSALAVGLIVGGYNHNYDIDGSKIKKGLTPFNHLIEYKGKDKIRYTSNLIYVDLHNVFINGDKYTSKSKDTLVYQEANKRYHYLLDEIDSIKSARKDLEIQKKLEEEREKTNKALEILKR